MIDYLKKKLEVVLDSIIDPIITKIVALSWRLRVAIVLVAGGFIATLAYPEVALNSATSAIRFMNVTIHPKDKITLSDEAIVKLHSSRQILWATLKSILDNPHDVQLTPWVASQVATAQSQSDTAFNAQLQTYFRNTEVLGCGCWRELPNSDKSPRLVQVSGWVLSAMASAGIAASDDEISFLLDRQAPAGWWPMYVTTAANDANASTYATAWALIGLQAQLSLQGIDSNHQAKIRAAISKCTSWLIRSQTESARWKDYPMSEVGRISESISGLVLHALVVTNSISGTDLPRQWLKSMPTNVPPPDVVEQSGMLTDTADGPQTDYYLQFKLPWLIIGTIDAFQYGSIRERVAATEWIEKSILQEGIAKTERDPLPWRRTELLVALRYLEVRLASQQ